MHWFVWEMNRKNRDEEKKVKKHQIIYKGSKKINGQYTIKNIKGALVKDPTKQMLRKEKIGNQTHGKNSQLTHIIKYLLLTK